MVCASVALVCCWAQEVLVVVLELESLEAGTQRDRAEGCPVDEFGFSATPVLLGW